MKLIKLKINTKNESYPIIIGSNLISNVSKIIENNSINFKQCLLVIDKNISKRMILKIKKSGINIQSQKIFLQKFQK